MTTSKEKLDALKQKIVQAFEDVCYPTSEIATHECEECRGVRRTFADLNWKTIEPTILEENFGIIPLFSPEAFHYFLPSYLIYSLNHFSEKRTNEVLEYTIYAVAPTNKDLKERMEYWQERFQDFGGEQIDCIYKFLETIEADRDFYNFEKQVRNGKQNLKRLTETISKS